MIAIYRGRRYSIAPAGSETVTLDSLNPPGTRIRVLLDDRDLLFEPAGDDSQLAEAFKPAEVDALDYPDGHACPPNHKVPTTATRRGPKRTIH